MTSVEPARHALYSVLEDVLGVEHARTLMTHLPQHQASEVATRSDLAGLSSEMNTGFERIDSRFDRLEDRIDRMQRFYVATTVGSLTALTAMVALISRL